MMAVLRFFLILVEVISALLLIGAILIQKTRGQGIGMAFGSGMGESLFGAHVGNVLTKATVVFAVVFLLNTTIMALMQSGGVQESSVTDDLAPVAPAPIAAPAQPFANVPTETPSAPGMAIPEVPAEAPLTPATEATVTPEAPASETLPAESAIPTEAQPQDAPAVTP